MADTKEALVRFVLQLPLDSRPGADFAMAREAFPDMTVQEILDGMVEACERLAVRPWTTVQ